jgi:hypothetical protein
MAPFRVLQLSMVLVMLFGSTWLVRLAGLDPAETGVSSTWLSDQAALAGVLSQGDNGDNGDNSGSNNNNANTNNNNANTNNNNSNSNNNSNTNSNNNNSSDDNGNEDSDDNDNFSFDLPPLPTYTSSEPSRPADPGCAQPGQDVVFSSRDGKATVRVFANRTAPVRVEILPIIDFLSAPLPPGNLVGLLAYEIRASHCDSTPLVQLPAEANLAIRYNALEATALNEERFVIGRLNMADGKWYPVEKRANDPGNNVTTATISETGFYMVWEER